MDLLEASYHGNEQAVRDLLAAGADPEAGDAYNRLPIHVAALNGHVGVVQLLLEAASATVAAADNRVRTPLYEAASHGHASVVRLLVKAAPAAVAAALDNDCWTSLHCAAWRGHTEVVHLLVEAAPATVAVFNSDGRIPLHYALLKGATALEAARCLVRAAPTVQPTLGSLVRKGPGSATLYPDLVSHLALTQQEWQSIPAPCPDLLRALPAVMERSVAEAGWLVGRLGQEQRARLHIGALCIGRAMAAIEGSPALPAELSQRILVAAMAEF